MTKHTPGPWRISGFEKTTPPRTVMGSDDFSVAYCDGRSAKENAANASLIAAAPDLLAACRVVKNFLDGLEGNTDDDDPLKEIRRIVHAPMQSALKAALDKAEGR